MKKKFTIDQIKTIVQEVLLPELKNKTIFTLTGPLGVGKTTLTKELFKQAGIEAIVNSPTFTYVKSYKTPDEKIFNHFDLYRIDSLESFTMNGFDELLEATNNYNFIEWPEIIEEILSSSTIKKRVCKIVLTYDKNNPEIRIIELKKSL